MAQIQVVSTFQTSRHRQHRIEFLPLFLSSLSFEFSLSFLFSLRLLDSICLFHFHFGQWNRNCVWLEEQMNNKNCIVNSSTNTKKSESNPIDNQFESKSEFEMLAKNVKKMITDRQLRHQRQSL